MKGGQKEGKHEVKETEGKKECRKKIMCHSQCSFSVPELTFLRQLSTRKCNFCLKMEIFKATMCSFKNE